jgi:hypothetical protein
MGSTLSASLNTGTMMLMWAGTSRSLAGSTFQTQDGGRAELTFP